MNANAYENGRQRVIPAVLVYLFSEGHVLMLRRDAKPGDHHRGKCNGLGGKMEAGESPRAAALREVKEEAGIALPPESLRARGMVHFPNFKPKKSEDWTVFIFSAGLSRRQAFPPCEEGTLEWVKLGDIFKLPLWPGDIFFLKEILEGRNVFGTVWYDADGGVQAQEIEVLR